MNTLQVLGLQDELAAVALKYCATFDEVMSRSRTSRVTRARHAVWFTLYDMGWSYPDIGDVFERDHTTVMSGVKAFADELGVVVRPYKRRSAA